MARDAVSDAAVDEVRSFNRFYTREFGLLDESHLGSRYSLPEVRMLFELAQGADLTPTALAAALGLDAGYVSRLLRALERRGLSARAPAPEDRRRSVLRLTAAGRRAIVRLQATTRMRLKERLAPLSPRDRADVIAAMRAIRRTLAAEGDDGVVILRDPRPGDLGRIVSRQAVLYAEEYGWDWTYEGLIAGICGRFVERFDAGRERCWIADRDGEVVGSVFVVRKSETVAQLRLLYVEPSARGLGIGARLVGACIAFARQAGYRRLTLWTNDVLVAARRIYRSAGFVLVHEEPHRSFGHDLVGQNWDLALRAGVAGEARRARAVAKP